MFLKLQIPDDQYEQYVTKFGVSGAESHMKRAIADYAKIDRDDRTILLGGDVRRAIEAVFQTTVDTPEKLLQMIQNLVRVRIGNVQMDFSSDQLARLAEQASFHGRTLEQYMRETVDELKSTMLERV